MTARLRKMLYKPSKSHLIPGAAFTPTLSDQCLGHDIHNVEGCKRWRKGQTLDEVGNQRVSLELPDLTGYLVHLPDGEPAMRDISEFLITSGRM